MTPEAGKPALDLADIPRIVAEFARMAHVLSEPGVPCSPARLVIEEGRCRIVRDTKEGKTQQHLFDILDDDSDDDIMALLVWLANNHAAMAEMLSLVPALVRERDALRAQRDEAASELVNERDERDHWKQQTSILEKCLAETEARNAQLTAALAAICKDAPTEEPESVFGTGNEDDARDSGHARQHWHDAQIARATIKGCPS